MPNHGQVTSRISYVILIVVFPINRSQSNVKYSSEMKKILLNMALLHKKSISAV